MDAADAEEVAGGEADEPPSEATPILSDFADGDGSSNSKEERNPALKVSPARGANVSQAIDKADDAPAGTGPGEGMDATSAVTKQPREDKAEGEQNTGLSVVDPSTEEDPKRPDQDTSSSADDTVGQLVAGVGSMLGGVDDRASLDTTPIHLAHQCPGADGSLPGPSGAGKEWSRGSILLELDNTAAVAAINRRGSSCSPQLTRIAHELWSWCWARGISVRAQHIPGHMNTEADQASRRVMDASSWKLCPFTFSRVNCLWGPVHTDLFADFSNHQVRHYYSWKPDPQAAAVDALSQDWTGQGLYAFPPFSLVSRCIAKLQTSNSPLILVAPVWPSQPWYASLLHHSFEEPRLLPQSHDLLRSHDGQVHPMLSTGSLTLAAWRLTNSSKHIANFRSRLHTSSRHHGGGEHSSPTPLAGAGGEACRSRRDNRDQAPEFRGTAGKALADLPTEQTPVRVLVWTVWEAPHFV
ncbi:hypothetical protein HPB47_020446 [Ixodes persulcatus]|uniref:Uncharacterized protein n=1 Tax=Ixodes persulcatus TaxID=34615 RepID=A0AC60QFE0_IXOPE|nr:hypothetical protein HPB47_020446 [Ixodes persulcatus]